MLTELWAPGLLGNLSYSRKLTAARKEWIAKHFTWEEKCNTFYIWRIEITLLFHCLFHLWVTNNKMVRKEKTVFFLQQIYLFFRLFIFLGSSPKNPYQMFALSKKPNEVWESRATKCLQLNCKSRLHSSVSVWIFQQQMANGEISNTFIFSVLYLNKYVS